LLKTDKENLFYDIYQTGLDNYTITFYNSDKGDIAKLFEYYINDAVYSALRLKTKVIGDTIKVTTNMSWDNEIHKLPSGKILKFEGLK
jgi:poly(3-hydroxyalkanoate) synthetase